MSHNISFSHISTEFLEDNLNLKETDKQSFLQDLLTVSDYFVPELEKKILIQISKKSFTLIETWTEQELITKHISPIINLVDYYGDGYNDFADRVFSYDFGNFNFSGAMDLLIAKGKREPKTPYFCLHEYKKERNAKGDPKGQLLGEMLVAQALNKDAKTGFEIIYGCYVVGRNWFWVILNNKEYAVSRAYDSTRIEDLSEIYLILVKIKQIIEMHIANHKK